MKKLKLSGITLSLAVIVVAGWVYLIPHSIELSSNPINRHILDETSGPWGTRLSLIPKLFPPGISKADVERQLEDAGYTLANDRDHRIFQLDDESEQGRIIYSRRADDIVCNKLILVVVGFDDDEKLFHAESAMYEAGCL